jgi:hypothetical protein
MKESDVSWLVNRGWRPFGLQTGEFKCYWRSDWLLTVNLSGATGEVVLRQKANHKRAFRDSCTRDNLKEFLLNHAS